MDAKMLSQETARVIEAARVARLEAEEANADVEAMIWEVQHVRLGHQRIVFSIDGLDEEPPRLN